MNGDGKLREMVKKKSGLLLNRKGELARGSPNTKNTGLSIYTNNRRMTWNRVEMLLDCCLFVWW